MSEYEKINKEALEIIAVLKAEPRDYGHRVQALEELLSKLYSSATHDQQLEALWGIKSMTHIKGLGDLYLRNLEYNEWATRSGPKKLDRVLSGF